MLCSCGLLVVGNCHGNILGLVICLLELRQTDQRSDPAIGNPIDRSCCAVTRCAVDDLAVKLRADSDTAVASWHVRLLGVDISLDLSVNRNSLIK